MNKTGIECVSCGRNCIAEKRYAEYVDCDGNPKCWCAHCYIEVIEGFLEQAGASFEHHYNLRERLEWDIRLGQAIIAERQALPWRKNEANPEGICQICGCDNIAWFTSNKIWNAVVPNKSLILCPVCFVKFAEAEGIKPTAWKLLPESDGIIRSIALLLDKFTAYDDTWDDKTRLAWFNAYDKLIDIVNKEAACSNE